MRVEIYSIPTIEIYFLSSKFSLHLFISEEPAAMQHGNGADDVKSFGLSAIAILLLLRS